MAAADHGFAGLNDVRLVPLIQAGDAAAFRYVYELAFPMLLRFAYQILGSRETTPPRNKRHIYYGTGTTDTAHVGRRESGHPQRRESVGCAHRLCDWTSHRLAGWRGTVHGAASRRDSIHRRVRADDHASVGNELPSTTVWR
jgi:hypothetical protein